MKKSKTKRPQGLGTKWEGDKFIHGPRLVDPKKCEEFRLGEPTKKGKRTVWCKLKKDGKWVRQSILTPKK